MAEETGRSLHVDNEKGNALGIHLGEGRVSRQKSVASGTILFGCGTNFITDDGSDYGQIIVILGLQFLPL